MPESLLRFPMPPRPLARCATLLVFTAAAHAASGAPPPRPSWGAIAAGPRAQGYAFDHATRDAAEREALAQCDRIAGRRGACVVRNAFDRTCGALAIGNFGEWGTATAPTAEAANAQAGAQCNGHLPTEPCQVTVSICSPRR